MVKLNTKLKAATLVESLVAMVIIVVCFSVAAMIFVNVINSTRQRNALKASLILDAEVSAIKKEKNFLDDEKRIGDWIIKRAVEQYPQTGNVYQLSLTVNDTTGKIIIRRNELITIE